MFSQGQGSQYVGMGGELYDRFEYVRELFEAADKALGFSISKLCFNGPVEELTKTYNTQPAILLASYTAWAVLNKEMKVAPALLAGHSLGEYTALLAAGLFSFKDALRITRKRGLLMEEACPAGTGGMVALLAPDRPKVEEACASVSKGDYVASPANLNSPDQLVLSGDLNALKEVVERLKGQGYKKAVFLNVSGPFHSLLMRPAAEKLKGTRRLRFFTHEGPCRVERGRVGEHRRQARARPPLPTDVLAGAVGNVRAIHGLRRRRGVPRGGAG